MYEFIKVLDSLEDNNFEINYQKGGLIVPRRLAVPHHWKIESVRLMGTASQVQLGVPRRGRG
jgi:hypothetical protein